ncbi:MAG: metallophosphoesterase [Acidimicrobiales bacterium]
MGADELRYVCMSDLHLGAQNSVLSAIGPDGMTVDRTRASDVMTTLFAGLRELVARLAPGDVRPTLVLNGDILEFALTTDEIALSVFEQFIDLAFPVDGEPIFDDRVLYLPGNHDHHLWETARERQYARYVSRMSSDDPLEEPWHTTPMLDPDASVEAEVLTAVVRRRARREQVSIAVVYPNLGFVDVAHNQAVVFHHGHFTEPLYRLMSRLQHDLFPAQEPGPEIWDWESDNFAWIDFFWSALGRSGVVGTDVGALYTMLQSPKALDWLAGNLSTAVTARYGPTWARSVTRPVLDRALTFAVSRAAPLERAHIVEPLSERAERGLRAYLGGPLLRQLAGEDPERDRPDATPAGGRELTVVFGHTPKPFERIFTDVPGWTNPVRVLNTGGWVVDTIDPVEVQGSAFVLVAQDGAAVSLRLFTEPGDGGSPTPVSVAEPLVGAASDRPVAETPMLQDWRGRVQAAVDADRPRWDAFTAAAAAAVAQRHAALPRIVDHAMRAGPGPGPGPGLDRGPDRGSSPGRPFRSEPR